MSVGQQILEIGSARKSKDTPLDRNMQGPHSLFEVLPVLAYSILTSFAPPIF